MTKAVDWNVKHQTNQKLLQKQSDLGLLCLSRPLSITIIISKEQQSPRLNLGLISSNLMAIGYAKDCCTISNLRNELISG